MALHLSYTLNNPGTLHARTCHILKSDVRIHCAVDLLIPVISATPRTVRRLSLCTGFTGIRKLRPPTSYRHLIYHVIYVPELLKHALHKLWCCSCVSFLKYRKLFIIQRGDLEMMSKKKLHDMMKWTYAPALNNKYTFIL